jgi:hypothetical protein
MEGEKTMSLKTAVVTITLTATSILYAKSSISQQDIRLRDGGSVIYGDVKARIVRFGGYETPECTLAVGIDKPLFFFRKLGSTCKRLTNSKGVKIVCNADKTVCKTRAELIDFVVNSNTSHDVPHSDIPEWCNASRLNRTEHAICADEMLSELDLELARLYGASKSDNKDEEQLAWLKKRNACKGDTACIRKAYETRIETLREEKEKKKLETLENELVFTWIKNDCDERKDADACNAVGIYYTEGKKAVSVDYDKAYVYFQKGCEYGSAYACYNFGMAYVNGHGTSKNLHNALRAFERSCDLKLNEGCSQADEIRERLKYAFRGNVAKDECYKLKEYGVR